MLSYRFDYLSSSRARWAGVGADVVLFCFVYVLCLCLCLCLCLFYFILCFILFCFVPDCTQSACAQLLHAVAGAAAAADRRARRRAPAIHLAGDRGKAHPRTSGAVVSLSPPAASGLGAIETIRLAGERLSPDQPTRRNGLLRPSVIRRALSYLASRVGHAETRRSGFPSTRRADEWEAAATPRPGG